VEQLFAENEPGKSLNFQYKESKNVPKFQDQGDIWLYEEDRTFLFFFFSGQSKLLVSSKELRFEAPQNKVTSHELVYSVQLNCQMSSIFSDKES
jgi:hypothetical protein